MQQLIISCSLSPTSRSAILAGALAGAIHRIGDEAELIDLRELELPFCDADTCYAHPNVKRLQQAIAGAAAVTLAVPIYNYGVGGAARNVVALTGKVWTDKVVGFVCGAGGQSSYMSVMNIANSLMLDFRSIVVPRFVYATGKAFDQNRVTDRDLVERIEHLAGELHRFGTALARP
jgi:FMN reductase